MGPKPKRKFVARRRDNLRSASIETQPRVYATSFSGDPNESQDNIINRLGDLETQASGLGRTVDSLAGIAGMPRRLTFTDYSDADRARGWSDAPRPGVFGEYGTFTDDMSIARPDEWGRGILAHEFGHRWLQNSPEGNYAMQPYVSRLNGSSSDPNEVGADEFADLFALLSQTGKLSPQEATTQLSKYMHDNQIPADVDEDVARRRARMLTELLNSPTFARHPLRSR